MASGKMDGDVKFGEIVATPVGILSYPKVWEAVLNDFSGKTEFSCSLLVSKQKADFTTLINAAMKPVRELFGDQYKKLSDFGERGCPLKDGDTKKPGDPANGCWIIPSSVNASRRPFVNGKDNRPIGNHEEIYGGAIGLLWVQPMAYHTKFGKGVKFLLEGVQKISDGKSFSSERFDPAARGFKAPEVPDYLRGHIETSPPKQFAVPRQVADPMPAHERALINAVTQAATSGFSGDIDDDSKIPF